MAKVFINFLGTGKYAKCRYYHKSINETSKPTRYIQESIIRLFCKDWTENDRFLFFLTDKATTNNWLDNLSVNEDEGLNSVLLKLKSEKEFSFIQSETVPILDGLDEIQIWDIFKTVSDRINPNDEIILDVTHAFRSIPMWATILLNYTKFVKNTSTIGIYYGNYEARDEKNNAPIIGLSSFMELQQWTEAADEFVNYGLSSNLKKLAIENQFNKFGETLSVVTDSFSTNRAKSIYKGDVFQQLKNDILELKQTLSINSPLHSILEKIDEKTNVFNNDTINNGFKAIDWCIQHNLWQQSITLFYEFIQTYVLINIDKDFENQLFRDAVSGCLNISVKETYKTKIKANDADLLLKSQQETEIVDLVFQLPYKRKLSEIYCKIGLGTRHDINHAGMRDNPKSSQDLKKSLLKYYKNFKVLTNHL